MAGFLRLKGFLQHFSHSVRMDVSAHFTALEHSQLSVLEGSGVPESLGFLLPGDSAPASLSRFAQFMLR